MVVRSASANTRLLSWHAAIEIIDLSNTLLTVHFQPLPVITASLCGCTKRHMYPRLHFFRFFLASWLNTKICLPFLITVWSAIIILWSSTCCRREQKKSGIKSGGWLWKYRFGLTLLGKTWNGVSIMTWLLKLHDAQQLIQLFVCQMFLRPVLIYSN